MSDYIRLPRSALTDDLWSDPGYGCLLWYLIFKADERGIATFTASDIEMRFGISRQRLRTMLSKMRKNGMATSIQPTSNQQATNITFDFQCFDEHQQPTSNQLPTNIQPTKRKKRTTKFTPPTDSEVAAYVAKSDYHFNPATFVPWYQSKGWMVGRSPMKDWRASCRTWEIEWKKKYGEKYYYEVEPSLNRSALRDQDVRYSELERAAETVLRNAPYNDAAQND